MNCTWAENSDLVSGRKEARVHELSVSEAARARLLSVPGEPLFIADWNRVLMIHYEVDPVRLQTEVPFELDLSEGRAFVTLVAFTLRDLRLRFGGWLSSWLTKPIATHEFLNVRTYVRHGTETGIYFLREWLSNRLSVAFGPSLFGLPYLHGRIQYQHELGTRAMSGSVLDSTGKGAFSYRAILGSEARFSCCEAGTLTEWLMERYSAFTCARGKPKFFRVWHAPWKRTPIDLVVTERSMLEFRWPFLREAYLVSADFSPGVTDVWMGRPHSVQPRTIQPKALGP